jgi:hypothetical protein
MKYSRLLKLKALVEIVKRSSNHWEDQERDERGRFGSGSGGSEESRTLAPAPKLSATIDSQRNLKLPSNSQFAGQGKLRDLPREPVLNAYKAQVSRLDPEYKTSDVDKGAVWSGKWTNTAKPDGWDDKIPHNPRPATNKAGDWKNEYKPPIDRAEINRMLTRGDLGEHQAKVVLHELYNHAMKRQGHADSLVYGTMKGYTGHNKYISELEAKLGKLPGSYEAHHMIPAAKGGSNHGRNLAILTHAEHVLAHDLEAVASRSYSAKPDKSGQTVPLKSDFAGYGKGDYVSAGAARYASALLKNTYTQAYNIGKNTPAVQKQKWEELKSNKRAMAVLNLLVKSKVLDSTDFKIRKVKDSKGKIKHRPVFRMSEDAAYAQLADYLERNKYV